MTTQAWIGSLGANDMTNWDICVNRGLWGSEANSASGVKKGDELFIWKSGNGYFARCEVLTDAQPPTIENPAPWRDGRTYKWIFAIRVVQELATPVNPGTMDGSIQKGTGLPNIRLGQFPKLSENQRTAVLILFGALSNKLVDDDETLRIEDDEHEAQIKSRIDISETEKQQLIWARRGQGRYRNDLLQIEPSCRVTGLKNHNFLTASHIKPWRDSDDFEKLDGNNGLMLSWHIDKLFDLGWIKFEPSGIYAVSPALDPLVLNSWRIEQPSNPRPFNRHQAAYLDYHRECVFRKTA